MVTTTKHLTRTIDGLGVSVAGRYVIDDAHTSVGFVARHLRITKVRGHLPPHWWEVAFYGATSAVTFIMVFVIQHTQDRQAAATQRKLDELVRAADARNTVIGIEDAPDQDLQRLAHEATVDREPFAS
jgi:hypothetical protein